MPKYWYPNKEVDYVLALDCRKMCVGDVRDEIIRIVTWHNDGESDIVFNIRLDTIQIFSGHDALAWQCPTHNTIEEIDLNQICSIGGKKTLHYKFSLPDRLVPQPEKVEMLLKFYPDKISGKRTHKNVLAPHCAIPQKMSLIDSGTIALQSDTTLQNPAAGAEIVVVVRVIDYPGRQPRLVKLKYHPEKDELVGAVDDTFANMEDVIAWVKDIVSRV